MKKKKLPVTVIKEKAGYSATIEIDGHFIGTEAETFEELKDNLLEAVNLSFEEDGLEFSLYDLQFEYNLESFFSFYKVINAKALSERIGMNQSLLAQYIKGNKKPSPTQIKRILQGVHEIGRELTEVRFLL
jgi:transcriptional regulator with XRE-family HTH domain